MKIGAVARLTGLSTHTLRKWEDRYRMVTPERTARGQRLYSRTDLKRLALIKRLTDAGLSPRELARKGLDELEEVHAEILGAERGPGRLGSAAHRARLGIAGVALPVLLARGSPRMQRIEIVATAATVEELAAKTESGAVDLVVLECSTVDPETPALVEAALGLTRARGLLLVYGFAAAPSLASLRRADIALMRAPVDAGELERIALDLMQQLCVERPPSAARSDAAQPIPPHRLDKRAILELSAAAPAVKCECPRHLAELILGLWAFEDYSAACEARNAEDATLHRYLWETAAAARSMFEEALLRVARAEGISLD